MVRTGTAGWSIPSALAEDFAAVGSHLERYAARMNCVEVNSSFYRSHRAATWQRWAESVPDGFRFAVKAPRTITHEGKLAPADGVLEAFLAETSALGNKRGPLLFQLPPSRGFEEGIARAFLARLRETFDGPAVFEPRHASWFTGDADDLLQHFGVARCAADPARHAGGDVPGGNLLLRYYRLHGSPRMYYSQYSPVFLDTLTASITDSRKGSNLSGEAWVIFDNTALGHALGDALYVQGSVLHGEAGGRYPMAGGA